MNPCESSTRTRWRGLSACAARVVILSDESLDRYSRGRRLARVSRVSVAGQRVSIVNARQALPRRTARSAVREDGPYRFTRRSNVVYNRNALGQLASNADPYTGLRLCPHRKGH